MDAVRGCGDSPPCPGFTMAGHARQKRCYRHLVCCMAGLGYNPHTFSFVHNQPKAPLEDEGREEMFMKHLFTMLLALIAATASAYDFESEGIYYNILSEDDRTVEVTESPYDYAGDITISAEVTYDGGTYSVTAIGEQAFGWCDDLTSVSMPSVTAIGDRAFYDCDALTSVSMPMATTIGNYAFNWCSALTSVEMPAVTTIGYMAFNDCSALTSVSMPSVTTIGNWAFSSCDNLASVNMPVATTIGNGAFSDCSALVSVSMPVATKIFSYAFSDCSALPSVDISSVTTIAIGAFRNCSALTSIDIPASVTIIVNSAFDGCNSLTSVYCHWEQPLECEQGFDEIVLATATLYVPTGTVDAYRSVYPWSEFANIEEGGYSGIADATASEVVIKVIDGAIVIEGGDGTASAPVVEVYSAGGGCVYRGTDSSIGGLGHGIYVVKVGGTVQKVAL